MVTEKRENRLNVNNQRLSFRFIVAGVVAVLLAITGFYWFLFKSPVKLNTPISQPGAAIFVSNVAPAMVSLLVNPEGLQSLEKQRAISQIKNSLLAKTNIDFNDDIKPWLSNEITLAVTSEDIDRDPENGLKPGYLMALATDNPEKSREFVELLFSRRTLAGTNLEVEQYKGVKLLYDTPEIITSQKIQNPKSKIQKSQIQNSLAGAVVDDFVLLANDIKVVKEAINNIQAPNLNLSSDPEYQKAVKELPKNAVAVAFFKLPTLSKWQGLELAESTYKSQILSLVLKFPGLLAESTFLSRSKLNSLSTPLSKPVNALKYIPESAGLAIAGANLRNLPNSNLDKLWQQITATLYGSSQEAIARWIQPLIDVQKSWDINWKDDIFSWVSGEYALAILPNQEVNQEKNINFNWVFVVEKSPHLEQGINKLNEMAINNGLNVSSLNLNNQKISVWTELKANTEKASVTVDAKIRGAHTNLDNYEIFTSDLALMEKIINHQEKSLIENTNFQNSIANIPQPNQGYVYIDWGKSRNFLESQQPLLKFLELLGKPLFDNLRSLTVSSYSQEAETLKGGIFFQLEN
ncbi:DUF3352 domain-containing protein [Sphaerospermopsis torques-reginae]|uniref:DUF3352 domain-containing protein n=1 Tax=Sphaerospermopsis torques-reginae ITEP-024 TaxID=984208 RepID=A0ABX8WV82_9CYAN|nr:DUF3352 domain-containing protein [Sphaerospermopsis torques-reginae]QYX30320.1 DUF3352 domain-containing protein [Sphaerospermopsis torques-reginae ITEP-024]